MSSVCFANSRCSNSYNSVRLDLGYLHEHLDADSYLGSVSEINFDNKHISDPTFLTETRQIPVLLTKKPHRGLHI